jgi:hypothetical protein
MDDKEQFQQETNEICELICSEVWPILEQIDEDYPNQSAFFSMFIDTIHILLYQGWTLPELIQEVLDHHQCHQQSELEDHDASELH